ncbi:MAG: HK97 family phage prohead protease [Sphingomonadales bacterium]|nr:HK97 family phage prohead protease [Sphingomonadales bacterium]MBD3773772.1 HK97 family phage prohead protease [Paracoccaceae bacterium]
MSRVALARVAQPAPDAPLRFAGYAAIFGVADGAKDVIRPGAFAASLAARQEPLPLFWQHRPEMRIGTVEQIAEDARGLRVIARIDNPQGRAATLLWNRAVSGLSFGYRARAFRNLGEGRSLEAIDIFEVSLVTHPLQHGARVHLVC